MTASIKIDQNFQYLFGEKCDASWDSAKYIILPIPMEKTTSYMKGTQWGPKKIIESSNQVEFFDAELGFEPHREGIYTDWSLALDPESFNTLTSEEIVGKIKERVQYWLDRDKFVLSIGGEHSITIGTFPPVAQKWKDQLTVLHFDAHADLKDSYEGSKYSHASAIRRILGLAPIVSVGIRSVDEEEYKLGRDSKDIQLFYAHEIRKNPNWIKDVLDQIQTPYVYVTFDLDGFDPSVVPNLGTPEPGGLFWYEAMDLLRGTAEKSKIIGADVNEIGPGPIPYSEFVAAKLTYKIIGYSQL